eukprot:2593352-Pyramimonas_sp.AAC.1
MSDVGADPSRATCDDHQQTVFTVIVLLCPAPFAAERPTYVAVVGRSSSCAERQYSPEHARFLARQLGAARENSMHLLAASVLTRVQSTFVLCVLYTC